MLGQQDAGRLMGSGAGKALLRREGGGGEKGGYCTACQRDDEEVCEVLWTGPRTYVWTLLCETSEFQGVALACVSVSRHERRGKGGERAVGAVGAGVDVTRTHARETRRRMTRAVHRPLAFGGLQQRKMPVLPTHATQ